jgi:hypothetical protein
MAAPIVGENSIGIRSWRSFQRIKGHEFSFMSPGAPAEKNEKTVLLRNNRLTYNLLCGGRVFRLRQWEENRWIRKLPGFWAQRLP